MRPLWEWPAVAWLLTGLPGGALGGFVGAAAIERGWWSDPLGVWTVACTLLGLVVGAAIWLVLVAMSYRR